MILMGHLNIYLHTYRIVQCTCILKANIIKTPTTYI